MQKCNRMSNSCCSKLLSEMQLCKLGLTVFPQDLAWFCQFGEFSWASSRLAYVIWRAILAAIMLTGFGLDISDDFVIGIAAWYFIYLTNWTLLIQNLYLCLAFAIALCIYLNPPLSASRQPLSTKVAWLLRSISQPGALVVSVAYWSMISQGTLTLTTFWVHAINSIVVFLDIITSCYEVRLAHYIYLLIYGIIYILWSIIHYQANIQNGLAPSHRYIYAPLDWSTEDAGKVRPLPTDHTAHISKQTTIHGRFIIIRAAVDWLRTTSCDPAAQHWQGRAVPPVRNRWHHCSGA